MPDSRPHIPDGLAREVRQRCGFGCVICRSPIYDYDHIEDYAVVREHTLFNLTLLCTTCHRKKKKQLLTKEQILSAVERLDREGRTAPDEIYTNFISLDLGGNQIQNFSGSLFDIFNFGTASLRFDGQTYLSAEITEPNGEAAISIVDNCYTLCRSTWDIEYAGNHLTFRNISRNIFAEIEFDASNKCIRLRGQVEIADGVGIRITRNGIFVNKTLLAQGNVIGECKGGIVIKPDFEINAFGFSGSGVSGGSSVSESYFDQVRGPAIFNSSGCVNNHIVRAQAGLMWSTSYLERLAEAKRQGLQNVV
jgi:hypothetical protein